MPSLRTSAGQVGQQQRDVTVRTVDLSTPQFVAQRAQNFRRLAPAGHGGVPPVSRRVSERASYRAMRRRYERLRAAQSPAAKVRRRLPQAPDHRPGRHRWCRSTGDEARRGRAGSSGATIASPQKKDGRHRRIPRHRSLAGRAVAPPVARSPVGCGTSPAVGVSCFHPRGSPPTRRPRVTRAQVRRNAGRPRLTRSATRLAREVRVRLRPGGLSPCDDSCRR